MRQQGGLSIWLTTSTCRSLQFKQLWLGGRFIVYCFIGVDVLLSQCNHNILSSRRSGTLCSIFRQAKFYVRKPSLDYVGVIAAILRKKTPQFLSITIQITKTTQDVLTANNGGTGKTTRSLFVEKFFNQPPVERQFKNQTLMNLKAITNYWKCSLLPINQAVEGFKWEKI